MDGFACCRMVWSLLLTSTPLDLVWRFLVIFPSTAAEVPKPRPNLSPYVSNLPPEPLSVDRGSFSEAVKMRPLMPVCRSSRSVAHAVVALPPVIRGPIVSRPDLLDSSSSLFILIHWEQSKSHREESASDEPDYDPDFESDEPEGFFLFEMETPSTNRLVIPFDLASTHFPPVATEEQPDKNQDETLQFTDFHHHDWDMKIEYYRDEHGFILTGWQKFSTQYNLKPKDLIRIYEPVPFRDPLHFLIEVVKKEKRINPPEFREKNFLFQIELDRSDIDFRRVILGRDDVRKFPGVKMQRNSKEKKIVRFTDANCKDWYMKIIRYDENKYMVIDGWDEFVKERGLEAGDLIRFYRHVLPNHWKHYLIRIVKKEGGD